MTGMSIRAVRVPFARVKIEEKKGKSGAHDRGELATGSSV